jgi:hypothetical protein
MIDELHVFIRKVATVQMNEKLSVPQESMSDIIEHCHATQINGLQTELGLYKILIENQAYFENSLHMTVRLVFNVCDNFLLQDRQ